MNSTSIGRIETKTMPIVTSEKLFLITGTLPNSQPAPRHSATQPMAPTMLVEQERGPRHAGRAGHKRDECAEDWHELPAENHSLAAVLLEERVRAIEIVPVQQAKAVALAAEDPGSDEAPD